MADADRLPRTGNIGRAAGLDPRPSLSKPTTAVFRVYLAHFLGTDVVRTVGYPTSRRTYHGHCAGQRAVEGRRSLGRNDRRAADPRLQGGDGPPSRGGAGGNPPQARPRGALRGSASSVTAMTCLRAPTRRCSAPVMRPRGPVPAVAQSTAAIRSPSGFRLDSVYSGG